MCNPNEKNQGSGDANASLEPVLKIRPLRNVFVRPDGIESGLWLKARVISESETEARVQIDGQDGVLVTVHLEDYIDHRLPLQNLSPCENLMDLTNIHEPGILYNLKERHEQKNPYTRSGTETMVAINPHQQVHHLFTEERKIYYRANAKNASSSPSAHIYEIAARSYESKGNQSIIVSGESGAGKTESVKVCLDFLSHLGDQELFSSIFLANLLLEAFGNASTIRNQNSSRFGKRLSLQFDSGGSLAGSKFEVYLLEKTRVVGLEGERNYHIFYQMVAANTSELGPFKCLITQPTYSDGDNYSKTLEALQMFNIVGDDLDTLLKALWLVLFMSNVAFSTEDDCGTLKTKMAVPPNLSELFGVETIDIVKAFTRSKIQVGTNEEVCLELSDEKAHQGCKAFAKGLYSCAFQWLVQRVNQVLAQETYARTIDFLDIFGFEVFPENRFEQLCINYANEVLQQMFAYDVFQEMHQEYEAEEVDLGLSYRDNGDIIEMISGDLSSVLAEESIRPQGNDNTLVRKLVSRQSHASSRIFRVQGGDNQFGIQHFAETVVYTAHNFIDTNRDLIPLTVCELAATSPNSIVSTLGTSSDTGRGKLHNTVFSKFRKQLSELTQSLRATSRQYIRCINPNTKQQPLVLEIPSTLRQLRSSGIIASVTIGCTDFPFKLGHEVLLRRFRALSTGLVLRSPLRVQVMALLAEALRDYSTSTGRKIWEVVKIGRTRTYLQSDAFEHLEKVRGQHLDFFATLIQCKVRSFISNRKFTLQRVSATTIASAFRSFLARRAKKERKRLHEATSNLDGVVKKATERGRHDVDFMAGVRKNVGDVHNTNCLRPKRTEDTTTKGTPVRQPKLSKTSRIENKDSFGLVRSPCSQGCLTEATSSDKSSTPPRQRVKQHQAAPSPAEFSLMFQDASHGVWDPELPISPMKYFQSTSRRYSVGKRMPSTQTTRQKPCSTKTQHMIVKNPESQIRSESEYDRRQRELMALRHSNRRLIKANENLQQLLFELSEEITELSQRNRQLAQHIASESASSPGDAHNFPRERRCSLGSMTSTIVTDFASPGHIRPLFTFEEDLKSLSL